MFLQFVKLKSALPEDSLLAKAKERAPEFEATPGLLQKYYVKIDNQGSYGGIYIWDNEASMLQFKASGLAKSIPEAYQVMETPSIELMDILFQLRT